MKLTKKEVFSIPNLLGYFRILLIPVFMYLYTHAESAAEYYVAAIVVGISGITDMMDGKIARRFGMITELGKLIDPLADKLTQGAVILCMVTRYRTAWILVAVFVAKEGFMGIMGLVMLRHNGRKLDGAKWFGKVCTAVMYVVLFFLLVIPFMPVLYVNGLVAFSTVLMCFTLAMYIPVFYAMWKEPQQ